MLFKLVPGGFSDLCNKLEQLEFKLEKILGFRNMQEKSENEWFWQRITCNVCLQQMIVNLSHYGLSDCKFKSIENHC